MLKLSLAATLAALLSAAVSPSRNGTIHIDAVANQQPAQIRSA